MARMPSRIRNLLPNIVVSFIEMASKKEPGSESWKSGVLRDMTRVLSRGGRGVIIWGPYFLTFREGTSNKFHMFAVYEVSGTAGTEYVASNGYGRIGVPVRVFEIYRGPSKGAAISAAQDKMYTKRNKGYEEER